MSPARRKPKNEAAAFPAVPGKGALPRDYAAMLEALKERIRTEHLRVALSANAAMVLLYWDIGRKILERQERVGWGAKVIDRLAHDLSAAFPEMKGLSPRNFKFMRAFAEAFPDIEIVKQLVSQIPWGHIIRLMQKVKDPEDRLWYVRKTLENGWSRDVLVMQIESGLHRRVGGTVNNFALTLPPEDSDLASQVFKNSNLYLAAVDDLLRHEDDKPTIGLLLCKSRKKLVVEYALRGLDTPMGVAEWATQLTGELPDELKGSLPTIEEIEAEFAFAEEGLS